MNPPAGSLIAFATDAGRAASDGEGTNGLYTDELTKHLLSPGLSIEQVFKRTRAGVMERSGGTQIPAEYSRLVGEDIFLAGPTPAEARIPKAQPAPVPTIAEINRLAGAGDAVRCIEALRRYTRSRTPGNRAVAPLTVLLDQVKENLRNAKSGAPIAESALETCELLASAATDCLPADHSMRAALIAKAHNRRGDALLLLDRADEALSSFNAAAALTPGDPYIFYNRGRALLALDRKEEAKADFKTAADSKFKKSAARKLAIEALAAMN
jgi:uncharacterized caspase-like protein